jgi:hypothetical protein
MVNLVVAQFVEAYGVSILLGVILGLLVIAFRVVTS